MYVGHFTNKEKGGLCVRGAFASASVEMRTLIEGVPSPYERTCGIVLRSGGERNFNYAVGTVSTERICRMKIILSRQIARPNHR